MPRRPRSHQLEDLSRVRVHEAFNSVGWTVEDLRKDYGEDLLVRIFDNGVATPLSFFVQAKATDKIQEYTSNTGLFVVPIERRHVQHWSQFWEPVLVSLWDSETKRTYWTCVQTYLSTEEGKAALSNASERLRIPVDKLLDPMGLTRIHAITKSRFERAENEQRGAEVLIDLLQEHLKLEIEYDPRAGILLVTPPGELPIVSFFGRAGEKLDELAAHWECPREEAFETMLKTIGELTERSPRATKLMFQMLFLEKQFEDKGEDFQAFSDFMNAGRPRKLRTKPGPPDIEELKELLLPRSRRSRVRKNQPSLFPDKGSAPPDEQS